MNDVNEEIVSTKKPSLWTRIWSAIIGAVMAVAAMFGITQPKIDEQKELVKQVQNYAAEALEAVKAGDFKVAKEKLEAAAVPAKDTIENTKETIDSVKQTIDEKKNEFEGKTNVKPEVKAEVKK